MTTTLLREVTDRRNIPFLVHALFLLFGDRKKKKKENRVQLRSDYPREEQNIMFSLLLMDLVNKKLTN